MIVLAWLIEKLVLKHLVNQEPIILFMATIGLAFVLEGVGDLMWVSDVKVLDVGIPSGGSEWLENITIGWASEGSEYYGMYIDYSPKYIILKKIIKNFLKFFNGIKILNSIGKFLIKIGEKFKNFKIDIDYVMVENGELI